MRPWKQRPSEFHDTNSTNVTPRFPSPAESSANFSFISTWRRILPGPGCHLDTLRGLRADTFSRSGATPSKFEILRPIWPGRDLWTGKALTVRPTVPFSKDSTAARAPPSTYIIYSPKGLRYWHIARPRPEARFSIRGDRVLLAPVSDFMQHAWLENCLAYGLSAFHEHLSGK